MLARSKERAQPIQGLEARPQLLHAVGAPQRSRGIDEGPLRVDDDEHGVMPRDHGCLDVLLFAKCCTRVHSRNSAGMTVAE